MPSNTRYPNIPQFVKPKKEDYDNTCYLPNDEESLQIFRESRSKSHVGEWMRKELGLVD